MCGDVAILCKYDATVQRGAWVYCALQSTQLTTLWTAHMTDMDGTTCSCISSAPRLTCCETDHWLLQEHIQAASLQILYSWSDDLITELWADRVFRLQCSMSLCWKLYYKSSVCVHPKWISSVLPPASQAIYNGTLHTVYILWWSRVGYTYLASSSVSKCFVLSSCVVSSACSLCPGMLASSTSASGTLASGWTLWWTTASPHSMAS